MANFAKSLFLRNKILNHVLRGQAYTVPSACYVGLLSVVPTSSSNGTEISAASYVRQLVTFSEPNSGVVQSNIDVEFPVSGEDWGTIKAVGVYDAVTNGNLLYFGTPSENQYIGITYKVEIPSGYIVVEER